MSKAAWTREQLSPVDWQVPVLDAAIHELDAALDRLRRAPVPAESLRSGDFALTACAAVMREVHARLVYGAGMAIVDGLPVERYTVDDSRAVAWLLASLLGRVVAQKQEGVFLYDVRDTGKSLEYGVRRSLTNLAQPFHTDGPWLARTPAFVGLFCLQSADHGGLSRYTSCCRASTSRFTGIDKPSMLRTSRNFPCIPCSPSTAARSACAITRTTFTRDTPWRARHST
jgi:hypothetical protein